MGDALRTAVKVTKVDAELGVVFGWAIVCKKGGEEYYDLQGDHIPEDVMAKAVTDFMADRRVAKEMHAGGERGQVVHSMIVTEATTGAGGIAADQTGWYVGVKPDAALLEKFKTGEVNEFSIGGEGTREGVAKQLAKDASGTATRKNKITTLSIDELSLVDKGAQEPTYAPIAKRGARTPVRKDAMLTTETDGHTHLLDDGMQGGCTSSSPTSDGNWHSHPYVISDSGDVTIGAVAGHTHDVDMSTVEVDDGGTEKRLAKTHYSNRQRAAMADKGAAMQDGSFPIKNKTDLENAIHSWGRASSDKRSAVAAHIKARAKALDLTDQLPTEGPLAEAMGTTAKRHDPKETDMDPTALRKALAELTTEQLTHYRTLATTEAQEAYLAKSVAEREQIAKAAREADAVVYTAKDGTVVRKSMDPTGLLAKAMKDADDAKEATAIEKAAREKVELEKRAEPLTKNLPGTSAQRAALVKAIESIADESDRKAALAMLKAANDAAGVAFETRGIGGATGHDGEDSAASQLQKKIEQHAAAEKISIAKATSQLLERDREAQELKQQADRERRAAARARA